jgi:hypothetical protein
MNGRLLLRACGPVASLICGALLGVGLVLITNHRADAVSRECAARGGVLVRAVGTGEQCVQVAR